LDEKTARTILVLGFKGRKKKGKEDPLRMAEACKFYADLGLSSEKIGDKFGVTGRLVIEFLSLLKLPPEVKHRLSKGEIGIDVGAQLSEAKLGDETTVKIGEVIAGMLEHDARGVIQFAKKFPNASLEEYKQRVLASKPRKEEVSMVVISLQEEKYQKLKEQADRQNLSVHDLGQRIIEEWLEKQRS